MQGTLGGRCTNSPGGDSERHGDPSRLGKPISYVAVPRGKDGRLAVGNLYADVFRGTTECSKGMGVFRSTSKRIVELTKKEPQPVRLSGAHFPRPACLSCHDWV